MRHLWTAGCDRNSRRRPARAGRLHRVFQAAPECGRRPGARSLYLKSSRPGGVIGDGTRRRSTSTNRSPRYSAMLSLNPRVGHSVRSGVNLVSRRGTGTLPTRLDPFACRNLASTSRLTTFIPVSTSIEACSIRGLIERPCEEFQNGRAAMLGIRADGLVLTAKRRGLCQQCVLF